MDLEELQALKQVIQHSSSLNELSLVGISFLFLSFFCL